MLGKLMLETKLPRTDPTLTIMQDLEELAEKLLEAARKLPPGPARHD
jgi:hypothetical protein